MKKPTEQLKRSKEWADKISLAKKGHKHSEETKKKIGFKSSNRSVESREKMSIAQKNKVMPKKTPEQIENLRKAKLGVKQPNISKAKKGKPNPSQSGPNSNLWKGGVTEINKLIRTSTQYKLWRTAVFERDNYTCIWCGFKGYIEADHIKPFSMFPELRFAIDNGRTLCKPCHLTTDTFGRRLHNKNYN